MIASEVAESQWLQLTEMIAQCTGLHFPRDRRDDLVRGIAASAPDFGFDDLAACVRWLLSTPPDKARVDVLATHLTIGETYFFRDTHTINALAQDILPELIRTRRGRGQRLRIWGAACCTGEEPYTLAILLHQLLPDLPDWHVTITATDINPRFLGKAATGVYGEWSLRSTPARVRERYFVSTSKGRYALIPEIRRMVRFERLNLASDTYPSLALDTNAMDVILCRNVLMYLTSSQMRRVIVNLHRSLIEGGWLAVSPSEASQALFPQFATVNFPGAIVYRKTQDALLLERPMAIPGGATEDAPTTTTVPPAVLLPSSPPSWSWSDPVPGVSVPALHEDFPVRAPSTPYAVAESLYQQGRYAEASERLIALVGDAGATPAVYSLLVRVLANDGRLTDALSWCNRWIAGAKLDAAARYLHAIVLMENGDPVAARSSLQQAIYLQPDMVLAHFALGNLARSGGDSAQASRHFGNALELLARHQRDDLLPEADGLTAGSLAETITALRQLEGVR